MSSLNLPLPKLNIGLWLLKWLKWLKLLHNPEMLHFSVPGWSERRRGLSARADYSA
jgi:hypothetical protein